eukprot:1348503-Amorphochlora_amoeboformis.AAC.2
MTPEASARRSSRRDLPFTESSSSNALTFLLLSPDRPSRNEEKVASIQSPSSFLSPVRHSTAPDNGPPPLEEDKDLINSPTVQTLTDGKPGVEEKSKTGSEAEFVERYISRDIKLVERGNRCGINGEYPNISLALSSCRVYLDSVQKDALLAKGRGRRRIPGPRSLYRASSDPSADRILPPVPPFQPIGFGLGSSTPECSEFLSNRSFSPALRGISPAMRDGVEILAGMAEMAGIAEDLAAEDDSRCSTPIEPLRGGYNRTCY